MKRLLHIYAEHLKINDYLNLPTHRQDRSGYNVNLLSCVHIHKITHTVYVHKEFNSISFEDFSLSYQVFQLHFAAEVSFDFAAVAFLQCAETQV